MVSKNGEKQVDKIVSARKPKKTFILTINVGYSYPGTDYGNNPTNFTINNFEQFGGYAHGFSYEGFHGDLSGVYMLSRRVGLEGRLGMDVNSAGYIDNNFKLHDPINRVYQYFAGAHISVFPSESRFNLSFIGLIGLASADVDISNYYSDPSFGFRSDNIIPGNGFGFAYYGGAEFSIKMYKKIHLSFSAGYLASKIDFSKSTDTQIIYSYSPFPNGTTTVSVFHTETKMNLNITQANFGISYQF